MAFLNVEIKARCHQPDQIRSFLQANGADFRGTDQQTDTYFSVPHGRLKLREGNIENNLIFYERDNQAGPKQSAFTLVNVPDPAELKGVLERSIGIKVVVQKSREIYFIGNVKFHIDEVPGLGSFIEIEASNLYADRSAEELKNQCDLYMGHFNIQPEDLVDVSYSDMVERRESEVGSQE